MAARWSRWFALSAGIALFGIALPALGWKFSIPFGATVNSHKFDYVRAEADGCELGVKLWFDAPADEYKSKAKNRNYYRFRARFELKNGKSVTTKVFYNDAPGRRAYGTKIDTSGEGCWAKEKTQIVNVDIEGCRAKGCKVEDFK